MRKANNAYNSSINTVSISKAIAIIMMVMVHAGINNVVAAFVCMFHMPVFFFVSGYCFKEKYLCDVKTFIKRRFSLYWNFVGFVSVFVLLHNIFIHIGFYTVESIHNSLVVPYYSTRDFVKQIVLVYCGMNNQEPLIGGFWFLRSLLLGAIIAVCSIKLIKNKVVAFLFIFLVSVFCTLLPNEKLAFWSSHFFIAAFFYTAGFVYKSYLSKVDFSLLSAVILFAVVFIISRLHPCSTMSFDTKNIAILAFCGSAGAIATLRLSSVLDDLFNNKIKKTLVFIGNHTLSILTFHFISFKVVSICLIIFYDLPYIELSRYYISSCGNYWWLVYSIFGVVSPLCISWLFNLGKNIVCQRKD